jgi:hypothetical protein
MVIKIRCREIWQQMSLEVCITSAIFHANLFSHNKKTDKNNPIIPGTGLSRNGKTLFNNWTVQKDLNNQGPLLSFSPFNNPIIPPPPPLRDPEKEFLVHAAILCKCCSRMAANRCHSIRHVVSFYFRSAIRQMTPHFHSGFEGCK